MFRQHGDEREDTVETFWEDDADRAAGHVAVQESDVVDVCDDARLERPHLVHRDHVVRPNGVVDVERELLVRRAVALVHLDHDRAFCQGFV